MIHRALLLAALLAIAARPVAAQPTDSIGRFGVRIQADPINDADESWVSVMDTERSMYLYWACSGDRLYIQMQPQPEGYGRSVTWRFDRDPARTELWQGGAARDLEGVMRLPAEENHAFTTRARSAGRLVIRQWVDGEEHDWFFDLSGSERALSRLACVRSLRPPVPGSAGDLDAETRPGTGARGAAGKVGAVETSPSLLNQDEISTALWSEVPRELRGTPKRVVLRMRVDTDGFVYPGDVDVMESPDPALSAAVIRLVPRMRFTPATVNGRPVRAWVLLPLEFGAEP
jgi:hypothetical protein